MPNRRVSTRRPAPRRPLLTEIRTDRAAGVLLAAAAGDALGVHYEGQGTMHPDQQPKMLGGGYGPYRPGEYSDDTQMQWCIADVAATGADLRSPAALDAIAANFLIWLRDGATDVGIQTRTVLGMTERAHAESDEPLHQVMTRQATAQYKRTGLGAGNGALMRTGTVALAHLDNPRAMAEAARAVSDLTHGDQLSAEACILWCSGIRTAVLDGTFDGVRAGVALLPENRRAQWAAWLDEAESRPPHTFANKNGFVVVALQAAWASITQTPVPAADPANGSFASQHLQLALENAVRIGRDTDTVAAIAGALLGARWGGSAVPLHWQRLLHGWPSQDASDLVSLAVLTVNQGGDDSSGWPRGERMPHPQVGGGPFAVLHPHDPGLIIGNLAQTAVDGPAPVDAVVSLCRVGSGPILTQSGVEHIRVWLVDRAGANADTAFVVDQAARIVRQLRQEGKRVYLHCVAGRSRTPAVAARYSCLLTGKSPADALADVHTALGWWRLDHNRDLFEAIYRLAGHRPPSSTRVGRPRPGRFDPHPDLAW
ncbi:ADP-ribosylglycohydrolase family protein [Streptomyces sp. TLI_171]|uniref:ADP-ribosylglycohydrolase family protein n=1 Tax=Streptomyces sp. TLI_171 TaxID=1938859 RepID=UPI000C18C26B|nr:ADP-ribosylglycohydrolase family protein [Streptomyces sp. TLI_171]RKE03009.1 ADP-ribosylglycohydrolase [Streptomyces sp. TLI_171]